MFSPDHWTQNHIWEVLWNHVHVCDWPYHLNVKFFLIVCKSGFQDNKIVTVQIGFKVDSFGKGRHFSSSEVDSAEDFSSTITEFEHIGVALTMAIFKSGDNWDGVEFLAVKGSVVLEIMVDLVNGQGNDGFVVHRFVLFFGWVHIYFWMFPALWIYIINWRTTWNSLKKWLGWCL